jgi:hypothetical protein
MKSVMKIETHCANRTLVTHVRREDHSLTGIAEPGYGWQRRHFDLDKLARLFGNFVFYENSKYLSFTTSRPLCAWLLRAFPNGTGNQSAA